MQRLETLPVNSLSEKITFIEMLTSILTSDLTLVGLSVLEVLDCLLGHLLISLKNEDVKFEKFEEIDANLNSEKAQDLETTIVQALINCIGNNMRIIIII